MPGRTSSRQSFTVPRGKVRYTIIDPNDAARSLRRRRTPVAGYISYELASARTPAIGNAITTGWRPPECSCSRPSTEVTRGAKGLPGALRATTPCGVRITPVTDVEPELFRLRARGLASVLCAHPARSPAQAWVSIDHVSGGRQAAEHLLRTGRRRLAFVTDTLELRQIADRFEGASTAVQRATRHLLGGPLDLGALRRRWGGKRATAPPAPARRGARGAARRQRPRGDGTVRRTPWSAVRPGRRSGDTTTSTSPASELCR
jgi:hypothetical protein